MNVQDAAQPLPRVGLVVPNALRRLGLQTLLGDGEVFEVIPLSAPKALALPGLEVVLIDSAATQHPLELVATFRRLRPILRLIVLGDEVDPEYIERVIGAGARGYLSHTARADDLRMAVDMVRDGSIWAPRKVLSHLLEKNHGSGAGTNEATVTFTPREYEVLLLLVSGRSNREIAGAIGVDEGTVKAHLARVMRKAGVSNRTALTVRALERRWTSRRAN